MKKHIFCTAALLLGATCASVAQEQTESVSFGVRVGYNVSSLLYSGSTLHKNDLSPKNGYHVGVVVDIKSSNKNFYFQPGLYFTKRGADYRCNAGIGYEYSLDLNYLQLPISVSYRPKVGKNVKLDINIAPYIAYGITGNMSGTEGGYSLLVQRLWKIHHEHRRLHGGARGFEPCRLRIPLRHRSLRTKILYRTAV
ncbi:porin family protein [uncultured Alistipes sp.]|uniref:porin family protein n=1 Tax=uncultured Alistipes sp. TaxID=538949 RepID=UPI0026037937|nr:porin family protein [uncultured Alistipes sp.]